MVRFQHCWIFSVEIPEGQLIGIIGPNGSGKSTLIKSMLGFVRADVGTVEVFGEDVASVKGRIAYVPQRGTVDWDFPVTVREVAAMGRYGKRRWWQDLTKEDYRIAGEALEKVRKGRVCEVVKLGNCLAASNNGSSWPELWLKMLTSFY